MRTQQVRQNATNNTVNIQVISLDELDPELIAVDDQLNILMVNDRGQLDWETIGIMFGPMEEGEMIILADRDLNWPRLLPRINTTLTPNIVARRLREAKVAFEIEEGWDTFNLSHPEGAIVNLWKSRNP